MYRSINRSLLDAEKLLELLNQPTDINDKPGAPDLVVSDGEIEFGVLLCSSPSVIDSMRLQRTSALRTKVANPHCVVFPSVSPKEGLWLSLASLERESRQSSVFFIDFMT
jgi:hypothetical protein